jgi:hypothetical protein
VTTWKKGRPTVKQFAWKAGRPMTRVLVVFVTGVILITATHFPYNGGTPLSAHEVEENRRYCAEAYKKAAPGEAHPASDRRDLC